MGTVAMPMLAKILITAGLVINMVGVCLLAYDALYGAAREFWLQKYANDMKYFQDWRAEDLQTFKSFAEAGHSEAYVTRLVKETNERFEKQRQDLENESEKWKEKYSQKVTQFALRGLLFSFLGFLLQAIGTAIW